MRRVAFEPRLTMTTVVTMLLKLTCKLRSKNETSRNDYNHAIVIAHRRGNHEGCTTIIQGIMVFVSTGRGLFQL